VFDVRAIVVFVVLVGLGLIGLGTDAQAIVQPSPMPSGDARCRYEGVFPGSGVNGTWEYVVADGAYTVILPDPEQLSGILERRLGGHTATMRKWTMTGQERNQSGLLQATLRLVVEVEGAGGQPARITTTVKQESVCPGTPRNVKVGDIWTCRDNVVDTWSIEGAGLPANSGTERIRRESTFRYLRNETVDLPDGTSAQCAVIQVESEDGPLELQWLDPAMSWCPIRVERRRMERLVGVDKLLSRELGATPATEKTPVDTPAEPSLFIWLLAFALIAAVLIAYVARRKRRP